MILKCGCVVSGVMTRHKGITYDPPIPVCVIHDCIEPAPKPDLAGRWARCSYYSAGGFRDYGPIHGGGRCSPHRTLGGCRCLVRSSFELPFFTYLAPESEDGFYCGCAGWD